VRATHVPRAGQSLRRHARRAQSAARSRAGRLCAGKVRYGHALLTWRIQIDWKATMATWIKCTDTKHEVVYINLDNAVTVTRNDVADRIAERGTVISFMGGEQIYIVVNEQPEEIIKPKL
jgi:hypothetical protein